MKPGNEIQQAPIEANEEIARIIFSPSMIANGQVSPSAFYLQDLPNGPETYVSVWRTLLKTPTPENVTFPPRMPGDTLAGYATIQVGLCQNLSFGECSTTVKPHPSKYNTAHAGIHYHNGGKTVKGGCQDSDVMMLAMIIAGQCELKLFDTQVSE